MKQLTTKDGAVFGPFNEIQKLADRYECDGNVHLPFTVVGSDCVIGEYVEPPPAPDVIDSVQEQPVV